MRMVVGLHADADAESMTETLRQAGARDVRPPAPSMPDVLVADFPAEDAAELITRLTGLTGVRYAEPDSMQDELAD
jgi:hypothetical protein